MTRTGFVCGLASLVALLVGILGGCAAPGSGDGPAGAPPTKAISDLVLPAPGVTPPLGEDRFVMKWLVLGPIKFGENDFGGGHQQASADKAFMPNEGALDGTQSPPTGAAWQEKLFAGADQAGQVNLDAFYNQADHAAAYAVAWLYCPQDVKDATLYTGSDDYLKVWVNGKEVFTYKTERRASNPDQDVTKGVALKQGYNRVVVKCIDVVYGWDFFLRFTTAEDKPIAAKPRK